ncbi:hypothetical protein FCH28_37545 [Streptomyces piniterrae]|uniref:Uncharacterized protein n=1 Tax=Streptomyces piniterrae TaxID=2571125 RepID=A0A4U0MVM8_9ACTN|nr:hypothetical protein [Streptomyces piniterrae]TJZ41194.1 hypothetical protein FCH28_37545 [Streptomyces piniterrae]
MRTIVNGQRIVTAAEFTEVAAGFEFDIEPLDLVEEMTAGGLVSRDALETILADLKVETDADREDAKYYRSLLRRMPRALRRRKAAAPKVSTAVEQRDPMADWTGADFDSYEVLASLGTPDPAAAVARARESRVERPAVRPVLSIVRTEVPAEVAA